MKLKTCCLACREHTNNIGSKRITMTNKVIRDKSRCSPCFSDKSRFMKQKPNKKSCQWYYKTNMLTYCLVCKKDSENKDAKMIKTKNGRLMLSSKCVVYGSKKSRFIRKTRSKWNIK